MIKFLGLPVCLSAETIINLNVAQGKSWIYFGTQEVDSTPLDGDFQCLISPTKIAPLTIAFDSSLQLI